MHCWTFLNTFGALKCVIVMKFCTSLFFRIKINHSLLPSWKSSVIILHFAHLFSSPLSPSFAAGNAFVTPTFPFGAKTKRRCMSTTFRSIRLNVAHYHGSLIGDTLLFRSIFCRVDDDKNMLRFAWWWYLIQHWNIKNIIIETIKTNWQGNRNTKPSRYILCTCIGTTVDCVCIRLQRLGIRHSGASTPRKHNIIAGYSATPIDQEGHGRSDRHYPSPSVAKIIFDELLCDRQRSLWAWLQGFLL